MRTAAAENKLAGVAPGSAAQGAAGSHASMSATDRPAGGDEGRRRQRPPEPGTGRKPNPRRTIEFIRATRVGPGAGEAEPVIAAGARQPVEKRCAGPPWPPSASKPPRVPRRPPVEKRSVVPPWPTSASKPRPPQRLGMAPRNCA